MVILATGVKLSGLTSGSPHENAQQVERLFQEALNPDEGQIKEQVAEIDAKLKEFECRYEMTSEAMRQKFRAGAMSETAEVCSWLMLVKLRSRFDACQSKTSA